MARYECTEGGSSKFWEITVEGASFTTTYGRIGQAGSSTSKTFPSESAARAAADKLVREKVGKGYVAVGTSEAAGAEVAADKPAGKAAEPPAGKAAAKGAGKAAAAPEAKRSPRAKGKKEPAGPPFPSFPGIEDRALRSLATKLDKTFDPNSFKHSSAILKANGDDWGSRHAILWHLVEHQLVKAEDNIGILSMLSEEPALPKPEVVASLFARLPADFKPLYRDYSDTGLLQGYPSFLDKLLFVNYRRGPDLFAAIEAKLPPNLRRALAFVKRRAGETIAADVSAEILEDLAWQQAAHGLDINLSVPFVRDGAVVEHELANLNAVRDAALLFGTGEAWAAALLAAAKKTEWSYARQVEHALLAASPPELAELLGSRFSFNGNDNLEHILDIVENKRHDPPYALLEAARGLGGDDDRSHANAIRELLAVVAARRFGEAGEPVPEALDALLDFKFLSGIYHASIRPYVAGLRAIPKERVQAMMRRKLAAPYGYSESVGALAAHFDEELLRAYLDKDKANGYLHPKLLGAIGKAALPAMETAFGKLRPGKRSHLHKAILEVLAGMASAGEPIETKWDAWIRFDDEGGEDIPYWDSERSAPREKILRALPPERSRALLLSRMREEKYPDRPFSLLHLAPDPAAIDEAVRIVIERRDVACKPGLGKSIEQLGKPAVDALCRHIGLSGGDATFLGELERTLSANDYKRVEAALAGKKETLRDAMIRLAAAGPQPRQRIYVLQVGREGFEPASGSLSRSGGVAPGLGADAIPKDKKVGEPFEHLFTLDLREMPELAARYPGARALALFCPEPQSGERVDEARLVPIAEADCERAPNTGQGERPIAVLGLDVPAAIFGDAGDPAVETLRKHVFNAAGHVLGKPLWIQEPELGSGKFVMQVNEALADVNLGDSGSLYVFERDAVMQCY